MFKIQMFKKQYQMKNIHVKYSHKNTKKYTSHIKKTLVFHVIIDIGKTYLKIYKFCPCQFK